MHFQHSPPKVFFPRVSCKIVFLWWCNLICLMSHRYLFTVLILTVIYNRKIWLAINTSSHLSFSYPCELNIICLCDNVFTWNFWLDACLKLDQCLILECLNMPRNNKLKDPKLFPHCKLSYPNHLTLCMLLCGGVVRLV